MNGRQTMAVPPMPSFTCSRSCASVSRRGKPGRRHQDVFYNGLGHRGLYIGGGLFIPAPHTGEVFKISSLSDSWYAPTWVGGRRVL